MIKAPCPRCKHVSHMPDSAGGLIGRCKQCGAIVRIPLADAQRKFCSVCHVEISQAKRVKDEEGDYFCIPCWKARDDASSASGEQFWDALEDLDKQ